MEVNSSHCVYNAVQCWNWLKSNSFHFTKKKKKRITGPNEHTTRTQAPSECNKYWPNYAKSRSSANNFNERRIIMNGRVWQCGLRYRHGHHGPKRNETSIIIYNNERCECWIFFATHSDSDIIRSLYGIVWYGLREFGRSAGYSQAHLLLLLVRVCVFEMPSN